MSQLDFGLSIDEFGQTVGSEASPFAPLASALPVALVLVILTFGIAVALYLLFGRNIAAALFAIIAGPITALLALVVMSVYFAMSDPPAARVGSIWGMSSVELAGVALLCLTPPVVAGVFLVLFHRAGLARRGRAGDEPDGASAT